MSDLAALNVRAAWHEAVAVVRQVAASSLSNPRHHGSPHASHVWLASDGSVRLEEVSGSGDLLVPALSELLAELLPDTAPGDLRLLADSSNEEVRRSTPQEFTSALDFFARPDDFSEIRALVSRAIAAREALDRSQALQALTERARHAPTPSGATPEVLRKPLSVRQLALTAGAVSAVCAAGVAAWALTGGMSAPAPSAAAVTTGARTVAQRVQHGVTSAAAYVRQSIEGTPEPPPSRGKDLELPRVRRRAARKAEAEAPSIATDTMPAETPTVSSPSSGAGPSLPTVDAPSEDGTPHEAVAAPLGVFSAAHPDVSPPAIVRAQMPEAFIGGLPPERPGVLELLVGADGQVVSAKLVPASNRHQDRMMVSAAKTWRFSPAMRDGQPVIYRLQMPITW